MAFYSHSKLSTFEQCRLKYKFKYIDKIPVKIEETIESFLGHAVHLTLEWLYQIKKSEGKIPTIDEVIVYYSEKWQQNLPPKVLIVRKDLTDKDYFEMGIKFLLDYYMEYVPFDENILETEKRISFPLSDNEEHHIIGFIDRLDHNKENNFFEIHDYKTGNNLPSQEKSDNDRQLALYALAIKKMFGFDKEVKLIWHYLAYNKEIHSTRTNEQLEKLKQEVIKLINEIESSAEFPYNKSELCNWCEYKDICPAWNNVSEKEFKETITLTKKTEEKSDKTKKQYPTLSKYLKED